MKTDYFFGYGSLVNRQTHTYPGFAPARVKGWRRLWQPSPFRPVAFLSVVASPGDWVTGCMAQVPNSDWAALDERERAYLRQPVCASDAEHDVEGADLQIYAVETPVDPSPDQPILLSYIDVVVQGYFSEHGVSGVEHFFDTTDGWHIGVRNDRAAPQYPRHQQISAKERDMVDANLRALVAVVE